MPSSDFVDFIHRASRICLGQSTKALVWRWTQICPLKSNIFTLSAASSTNEVSMFKLAIEVCFENHFGLIHAIFLSLGSTKSGYFFLGHPVFHRELCMKDACFLRCNQQVVRSFSRRSTATMAKLCPRFLRFRFCLSVP